MKKKRVVIIAPGRGSYTKETLGYLKERGGAIQNIVQQMDEKRRAAGDPTITELDSATTFKPAVHTKGEHASTLIYACSLADFYNLDRNQYEVVAVTGNSMGWYIALVLGGALDPMAGFDVIQTMGGMMREEIIGGQIIYPIVDDRWLVDENKKRGVWEVMRSIHGREACEVYLSIELGGYIVIGANKPALAALLKELPKEGDFPFQLINHAAFHTPLLQSVSERGFASLSIEKFKKPEIPLIDGRGEIWQPYSTSIAKLHQYTLGHQVVAPYDFTKAVTVALKEFAPDHLVLLGPGNSLGGSVGQILVMNKWKDIVDKASFSNHQKTAGATLISLGAPGPGSASGTVRT